MAYLEPVHEPTTTLDRMRAAGLVQSAAARGTRGLPPIPLAGPGEGPLTDAVLAMRDEERC